MKTSVRAAYAQAALALLVVVASLAAFAPALDNGFVAWDDRFYFLENTAYRGLGWAQWSWAWTTARGGLYQPLTWLSFSLDHAVWGLLPGGYHLTNLLLHAAAAVLFFFVGAALLRVAGVADERERLLGAAAAALLFAVHPLRVESAAWATERKDVLSAALWLGALLCYLRRRLPAALALFALSLLAKAGGVMLPLVLILLDVYPLRRRAWLEKLPFAALSVLAVLATSWSLRHGGDVVGLAERGWSWRAGQALYGLWFYPLKTLWPAGLSPYHPPPDWFRRWSAQTAGLAALTLAAGALLWRTRRRHPAIAAAAVFYIVMLAPVSGLVQNGLPYAVYERYGYLPSLGLAFVLGAALARAARRRPALLAAGAAWLLVLGMLSWRQTRVWESSQTLWTRILAGNPGDAAALNNLGAAEAEAGRWAVSASLLERAVALQPGVPNGLGNLGAAYRRLGRSADAQAALRQAVSLRPGSSSAHAALGTALLDDPRPGAAAEAAFELSRALELGEEGAAVHDDLGSALLRSGRADRARTQFEAALRLDADDGVAENNLGLLDAARGERPQAILRYRAALRDPKSRAEAEHNWGDVLLAEGRFAQAERHYREAARLAPDSVATQVNWGNALARSGRLAEAAERYRAALKKDPGSFEARANLSAVRRLLKR